MKTLLIDSSRKSLSIVVANKDKLILVSNVESYSKHSNYLMNEIKNMFDKLNFKPNDIDNYVVLNGPGSFTGLRVGVTISKTLAWSLSKKLYQLSNLKALKVGIEDDIIISIIPDKKDYSYIGFYTLDKIIEEYLSFEDELFNINDKNITIVSMEDSEYLNSLVSKLKLTNNVNVKIIKEYDYLNVINYALSSKDINPHLAEPIYLKKIDAEKK